MPDADYLQRYDDLLAQLYQGLLEAEPWQQFLESLRSWVDVQVVSLVLRPPAEGDQGVIINSVRPNADATGSSQDWQLTAYRQEFFTLDPFINLPPDRVVTLQDLVPDEELLKSDYYIHYLEPVDLFRILGVDTREPEGTVARLRLSRRRTEEPFSDTDRDLLQHLTPHLQRAVQIHGELNRAASERDVYAGAVEQLSVASVVLDEQARVLHTNALAKALLEEADGLSMKEQKLVLAGRELNQAFQEALVKVLAAQPEGETSVVKALRVPRAQRAALGLVIRPVPERGEGQHTPSAAVFISDPELEGSASRETLGQLFELTPAESNLAILLTRGLSLAEAAEIQNVSQHTTRAQLKSIFAKTGVSRQAELVRLVLKSVATLG
jgi:DNA-binding CsgD family transcriptional regulator